VNTFKAKTPDRLPLERSVRARTQDGSLSSPEPLSNYRDVPAWVLLADPGAGKTDTFKTLCAAEGGYDTTARNFVTQPLPSGQVGPIFIDGLDEMAAGGTFDQIRANLQLLGTPKFRISCREADWRGNVDSKELQRLVGSDNFAELHLAPLTREQTQDLIAHWQQSSDDEAERFMREAKQRDLSGLLDNPQTLRMLVKAHAANGGDWPASKTQTYEMACAQLVQEPNEAHRAAQENNVLPFAQVLEAAGYLSAVMLLSGSATIVRQLPLEAHANTLALSDLSYGTTAPDKTACQAALHTRLFRGRGTGQREFIPVHRTVAEYQGARYLRSRIDAGLPASRVLALMMGEDGGIVPELRGLHAWLAATASGELRRELIERDPLGVVLNGDVRQFNRDEKLQVLKALRDEATRYTYFRNQNWTSHPFGALATLDMEGDFKTLLQSADRSPPHFSLLDCVLDALVHGQYMPALAPALEQVVRDKTYRPDLRTSALDVLVAYACEDNDWSALTQLLADVDGNMVEDLEDELLGTLLQALYPGHISPAELWRHFRKPKAEDFLGTYWQFWHELAKADISRAEAPTLLDALFSIGYQLSDQRDHLGSSEIVGKLLARGVRLYGTEIDVERLDNWLSLGHNIYHSPLEAEHKEALKEWLEEHPAIYKALFEYGLQFQLSASDARFGALGRIQLQLYDAAEPDDAGPWYLALAEASTDGDLRRKLVCKAFGFTEQKVGSDAAIELLEYWSADHANDTYWIDELLQCAYPRPECEQQYLDARNKHEERKAERSRERTEFFKKVLLGFEPGPAHLGALVEVANAYLNFFQRSKEKTPSDRLLELLDQDKEWLRLALHGLRQCLFRDDLPSAAGIVDLHAQSRRYHLASPCLAAMELRYAENPATAFDLSPALLETVVAFRLTTLSYGDDGWFTQLLTQQPLVLASVMSRMISQQIATKTEHIEGLYALARNANYVPVAKQITPQLTAGFPVKASEKLLKNLRLLIVSVLTHLDRETQLSLIADKLGAKGMDVAQQAYWWTAGVLLAPELYLERIQQFVAKTQTRASHVFALIHERSTRGELQADLPLATQVFLIELLGPRSNPSWSKGSGLVTLEMNIGEYVGSLITMLAGNPDDAATQALTHLQQRQDMKHWNDTLSRALYDQRITRRKARFKPATVTQVCDTLANLKPANAADLWALTVDHLKQRLLEIRNGSSNDYRQYWAGETPKLEDDCRDALLSDLRKLLQPLEISAEREGHYADAKRADIKIIAGALHLPIEIKREMHKEVWTAIGNQLVAKYSKEVASDGYGIYLVFWFTGNPKGKAAVNDGGNQPKTPQELQQRLTATVPEALKHKIAVLVVDCSKPQAT